MSSYDLTDYRIRRDGMVEDAKVVSRGRRGGGPEGAPGRLAGCHGWRGLWCRGAPWVCGARSKEGRIGGVDIPGGQAASRLHAGLSAALAPRVAAARAGQVALCAAAPAFPGNPLSLPCSMRHISGHLSGREAEWPDACRLLRSRPHAWPGFSMSARACSLFP